MKFKTHINHFNDFVAEQGTKLFGTMWTAYAFIIFASLPIIFPALQSNLLYGSNAIQLVGLPMLAVGQALANKLSERRAQKTYDMVRELIKELDPEYNEKKKKR